MTKIADSARAATENRTPAWFIATDKAAPTSNEGKSMAEIIAMLKDAE